MIVEARRLVKPAVPYSLTSLAKSFVACSPAARSLRRQWGHLFREEAGAVEASDRLFGVGSRAL
jgi:hypothetical protein